MEAVSVKRIFNSLLTCSRAPSSTVARNHHQHHHHPSHPPTAAGLLYLLPCHPILQSIKMTDIKIKDFIPLPTIDLVITQAICILLKIHRKIVSIENKTNISDIDARVIFLIRALHRNCRG